MNTRPVALTALLVSLTLSATATDCNAQSKSQLKKELKTREAQAAKDPDALVTIAKWARDKGLTKDATRLLESVIKEDPEHEGARTELGFVKFDGEWVTSAKAEVLQTKAAEAAMKAEGMVKVGDVWVAKDKVKDAKVGIYWHDGQQVSLGEKKALSVGKVRHPKTGAFIPGNELGRAQEGLFRSHDGKWMTLAQANEYHADRNHPWLFRTKNATIASTLPLDKIEAHATEIENGIDSARPVFNGKIPGGKYRPTIWIAPDVKTYQAIGGDIGDGESAYGAFHAIQLLNLPDIGEVRVSVCHQDGELTPYLVRHAAALSLVHGIVAPSEIRIPAWFPRAIGSLAERFRVPSHATYFAKQHVGKGGVKDLKSWFSSFQIDPGMAPKDVGYNIFQAGLVAHFAMKGNNEECLEAFQGVTQAILEKPKNAKKAFKKFVKELVRNEDALKEHLRSLSK